MYYKISYLLLYIHCITMFTVCPKTIAMLQNNIKGYNKKINKDHALLAAIQLMWKTRL